jgi:hypothetical protein
MVVQHGRLSLLVEKDNFSVAIANAGGKVAIESIKRNHSSNAGVQENPFAI